MIPKPFSRALLRGGRAVRHGDEDVASAHLVLGVPGHAGVRGLHLLVAHPTRFHLVLQQADGELLPLEGIAHRLHAHPLLRERLAELRHVHPVLTRELLDEML